MADNPGARTPRSDDHGSGGADGEPRRALAVALVSQIDELTRRVVADIHAHSGTYASGAPVSRDDLWEICRDNLLRALEDFGGLPPAGVTSSTRRARRDGGARSRTYRWTPCCRPTGAGAG